MSCWRNILAFEVKITGVICPHKSVKKKGVIHILSHELLVIYGDDPKTMAKNILKRARVEADLSRDMLIGIKPNLILAKPSESGATTSPELVSGVIEFLRTNRFNNIKIMESSWVGDRISRAFKVCGYDTISQKYNVPLVDLKKDETVELNIKGMSIKVAKSVLAVDYLINIPVLKAHCQTKLTCALKNLKGCIPDAEKRRFHTLGLHKPIAYLNSIIKTDLVIVDGIIGDLTFEEGGNPVQMNRIILGKDPVLVDSYACELLGYDRKEVEYIGLAEKLGVGMGDLNKAKITEINKDSCPREKLEPTEKIKELARWIMAKNACSACYGSLVYALERMREKGKLKKLKTKIAIGQGYKNKPLEGLGVGTCTRKASYYVAGCPPKAADIVRELEKFLSD